MSDDIGRYEIMDCGASACTALGGGIYDTPNSSMTDCDAEISDLTGTGPRKNVMEPGLRVKGPSPLPRTNGKPSHSALPKSKAFESGWKESLPSERRVQRLFIAVIIVCLVLGLTALAIAGMAFKNSAPRDSTSVSASKQEQAEKSVPGTSPCIEVYVGLEN